MPKQWVGRVSVALSLVRVIYSYRRSQLSQRLRALQLLPQILWLTRQMFRPSPRSSEAWFVGGQMLGLALTILEHRYPSQRPLVTRVGLLAQGTGMWLSRYVVDEVLRTKTAGHEGSCLPCRRTASGKVSHRMTWQSRWPSSAARLSAASHGPALVGACEPAGSAGILPAPVCGQAGETPALRSFMDPALRAWRGGIAARCAIMRVQ